MLGLFKLQEKKSLCTNPVSYKTSRAGHKEVGVRGHPWAGEWVPVGARGEKGKGAPKQKGTDCPNGRGAKGTSEEGNLGGRAGQCFLRQGTVLEGAQCHRLPTPGTWRTSDP